MVMPVSGRLPPTRFPHSGKTPTLTFSSLRNPYTPNCNKPHVVQSRYLRGGCREPLSHQLPWWRPLRHEPATSFVAVLFSISAKDSAFRLATSAVHVPENDCPFVARAVHGPCQLLPVFCADHVPSSNTSPASLRSVHDPRARLGL